MTNNKQQSTLKKSVLSIVIISSITGGLIALEKYQTMPQSFAVSDSMSNNELLKNSLVSTDVHELALIAEANLISEELIESDLQLQHVEHENEMPIEVQHASVQLEAEPVEELLEKNDDKQIVIENEVLFAFDSSEIEPSYYQSLNETAEFMKGVNSDEQVVWQVVGYADQTGNARYNNRLAKKRAQAVAEFLVNKGVDEDQLAIVSLGDSQTQYAAADKGKTYLDRRVEIHAYQAEIAALVEQLNKPKVVQHRLPTENRKAQENRLSLKTLEQQSLPIGFHETAKPLSTAMEF